MSLFMTDKRRTRNNNITKNSNRYPTWAFKNLFIKNKPFRWGMREYGLDLEIGIEDPEEPLYIIELDPKDSKDEESKFEFWLPTKEDWVAMLVLDHGIGVGWISSCVWLDAWNCSDKKGSFSLRRISSFSTIKSAWNSYPVFLKTSRNFRYTSGPPFTKSSKRRRTLSLLLRSACWKYNGLISSKDSMRWKSIKGYISKHMVKLTL